MAVEKFLHNIDLAKNQILQAVVEVLASAPGTPVEGQIYYNSADETLYVRDSGGWLDLGVQGGGLPVPDTTSIAEGSTDATKEVKFEVDGNTTGIVGTIATIFTTAKTVTLPDATDTLVGKATTDVLTNKSYDLGGAGNVLTGSLSEFNAALQSDSFATLGGTNVFTAVNTFEDDGLQISNPADTFQYTLQGAAIVADRLLNLPLLVGTDTLAVLGLAQTFTATITLNSFKGTGGVTVTDILDDDTFGTASATTLATSESILALVLANSAGLSWKDSVLVASIGDLTLSGEQTIDGILTSTNRVLVKNQSSGEENGIYVTAAGAWSRATDADTADKLLQAAVFVREGTINEDEAWVLITDEPITLDTTPLVFTQFTGLGNITAGAGLTKSGNTIDVVGTSNRIIVNADSIDIHASYIGQASITTLGTIGTGVWQGTVIAEAFLPNATETAEGVTEIATQAETDAGSDDFRYLTSLKLHTFLGTDDSNLNATVRYTEQIGDAAATTIVVTHGIGRQFCNAQIFETASTFNKVQCEVRMTSTTTTTFVFNTAPASNEYTVVITG